MCNFIYNNIKGLRIENPHLSVKNLELKTPTAFFNLGSKWWEKWKTKHATLSDVKFCSRINKINFWQMRLDFEPFNSITERFFVHISLVDSNYHSPIIYHQIHQNFKLKNSYSTSKIVHNNNIFEEIYWFKRLADMQQ